MSSEPTFFDNPDLLPPSIPARGSSTKYQTYSALKGQINKAKASQSKLQDDLKRKASQLSTMSSGSAASDQAAHEFLNDAVAHRATIAEQLKLSKRAFNELFKLDEITKDDYLQNIRGIVQKQARMFAGDVTIKRHRDRLMGGIAQAVLETGADEVNLRRALAHMLLKIVDPEAVPRDLEQPEFRKSLINWYGVSPGGKQIWCPILQAWGKNRTAAHIVPDTIGYETIGDLFGEPGQGERLMWSVGNGMMLDSEVEDAFDKHWFCLLPIVRPGQPDGWKVVLLNESVRDDQAATNITTTWDELDGRELRFRNEHRPQRRFLYFHYCMAMVKMITQKVEGWEKARDKTRTGQMWATPGPYIRASMLKKLALHIGDVEIPDELTNGHGINEALLAPDLEEVEVKDLAWHALLGDELPPLMDEG